MSTLAAAHWIKLYVEMSPDDPSPGLLSRAVKWRC